MPDRFYVTTPIYYSNDLPHLGHAYTTVAADVLARYHRLKGHQVRFLTGLDEHGQKVLRKAQERGVSPQEHVDALVPEWTELWERMDIVYDDFIRTTDERHKAVVQAILQSLFDRGEIYQDAYEGWYSTAAEKFWTEKDLIDGKCPDTGQPVEWLSETNYFFRMAKYADQLRQWVEDHPDFVQPETRRNELLGYLRKEVGDLCISRPKTRMSWGIELPFDADYVTYVWFDALINYISTLGYDVSQPGGGDDFAQWWPASIQLVGKDILTTHAVYWSTMLFALGLQPTEQLFAHGWWKVEGKKMSKSLKNVVHPNLLIDSYGVDAVRYFLFREIAFGADGDFAHKNFLLRYNSDLANDLGNLGHRGTSMINKWLGGTVPSNAAAGEAEAELQALAETCVADFDRHMAAASFKDALESMLTLVRAGNKYVDTQEPWTLNRNGQTERLAAVMRAVLEVSRISGSLLTPFCPNKGPELLARFGAEPPTSLEGLARFDVLTEGDPVVIGDPLFPRMRELPAAIQAAIAEAEAAAAAAAEAGEAPAQPRRKKKKKKRAAQPAAEAAPAAEAPADGPITFDDFKRVQLRTGRIVEAAQHPNADRLLVLKVDVGEEAPRSIVAGIAERYAPEDLPGRTVVVVTNLKPAKIRGVRSQGMLLAAGGEGIEGLTTILEDVAPGTVVR